jgi:thioester reductase-like protein
LQKNGIAIIVGEPRLYAAIRKGIMDKINRKFLTRSLFKLAETVDSRALSKVLFKKVHLKFGGKVEYLVCGGAKMDEDAARDFKTLGFEMLEGFCMTEAASMITLTRPGHVKVGSAGQPMPGLDVRIENGEIIARGRNIMQGYYNRPEETAKVLKGGWLHTGDTGYFDGERYIYITGNLKEIIVFSGGEKINPEKVEKKLSALSDCVAEAGVFVKNDTLQAAIYPDLKNVVEKGVINMLDLFHREVIDPYNSNAAIYKKISKFILVKDELPKTGLGKIQRFKLASILDEDTSNKRKKSQVELQSKEYHVIRKKERAAIAAGRKCLYEECLLDEDIWPQAYNEKFYKPQNILITGATGFVGAYLIRDLLLNTDAVIYSLVRRSLNRSDGFSRIKHNMQFYKCWDNEFESRVIPVLGELSKPKLGIRDLQYIELSKKIDMVFHNGASINYVCPYEILKKTNVVGTKECLRFACTNKPKRFNHVSSFTVYDNPSHFNKIVYEDDSLSNAEGYCFGYSETKWVAEKLVRSAGERGLKTVIYRPGEITGDCFTGIWKINDMVSRFLSSCIQMGVWPRLPMKVHMTPVDFVSRAIVDISLNKDSYGKCFNLMNKKVKILPELIDIINRLGYCNRLVAYEKWKTILAKSSYDNFLKPLESLFFEDRDGDEAIYRRYGDLAPDYDMSNTEKFLAASDIKCAAIDGALIGRYLAFFEKQGYLKNSSSYKCA